MRADLREGRGPSHFGEKYGSTAACAQSQGMAQSRCQEALWRVEDCVDPCPHTHAAKGVDVLIRKPSPSACVPGSGPCAMSSHLLQWEWAANHTHILELTLT